MPNLRVIYQKDANGKANSEDPDQTTPRSSLNWVCTVCPDLSVRKLRIITVESVFFTSFIPAGSFLAVNFLGGPDFSRTNKSTDSFDTNICYFKEYDSGHLKTTKMK